MNGSTGHVRHDEYTEADYRVATSEAFAESTWCVGCLLEYIEQNMGSCLQFVQLIRPDVDLEQHAQVVNALKTLGVDFQQL
jgi:hypothetical protein